MRLDSEAALRNGLLTERFIGDVRVLYDENATGRPKR